MKRSEMIKKIHDKLVGEDVRTMTGHANFAEHLLDFVEGIGMVPPETIILPDHYNRSEGEMGYRVHEWDVEDEN